MTARRFVFRSCHQERHFSRSAPSFSFLESTAFEAAQSGTLICKESECVCCTHRASGEKREMNELTQCPCSFFATPSLFSLKPLRRVTRRANFLFIVFSSFFSLRKCSLYLRALVHRSRARFPSFFLPFSAVSQQWSESFAAAYT